MPANWCDCDMSSLTITGGGAAEFEPLTGNYLAYDWALAQYFGYGVAACYRGPRSD